jgi:hypothetical protein
VSLFSAGENVADITNKLYFFWRRLISLCQRLYDSSLYHISTENFHSFSEILFLQLKIPLAIGSPHVKLKTAPKSGNVETGRILNKISKLMQR